MDVLRKHGGYAVCVEKTENPLVVRIYTVDIEKHVRTRKIVVERTSVSEAVEKQIELIDSGAIKAEVVKKLYNVLGSERTTGVERD